MTLLNFITATTETMDETPIKNGNVIYCSDTNTTYIDRSNIRVKAINIVYYNSNQEFPDKANSEKAYVDMSTGYIYLYEKSGLYVRKSYYEDIEGTVIQDPTTLLPKVILRSGKAIAPRTIATAVYSSDGEPLSETLDDIINNKKRVMKTKIYEDIVPIDGMTIFNIPYPTDTFDFSTDTMLVLVNGKLIDSQYYRINDTQIIFDEPLNKDDVITYIFHYVISIKRTEDAADGIGLSHLSTEVLDYIRENGGKQIIEDHINNFDNPHQVTAEQLGADIGGGTGSLNVFKGNTIKNSFTATETTDHFDINFGDISTRYSLLDVYFHGLKLMQDDDYELRDTVVYLSFDIQPGETINYEISEAEFSYDKLSNKPRAINILTTNGESIQTRLNKMMQAIIALGGVID